MEATNYALLFSKNWSAGVLFDGWQGNQFIAESLYRHSVDALIEQKFPIDLFQPRPYGGNHE